MTRVPAVGDAGGVGPVVRRIITPVKSASVGLTQDRVTEDAVTLEDRPVTGPGGVVSGEGRCKVNVLPVLCCAGAACGGHAHRDRPRGVVGGVVTFSWVAEVTDEAGPGRRCQT